MIFVLSILLIGSTFMQTGFAMLDSEEVRKEAESRILDKLDLQEDDRLSANVLGQEKRMSSEDTLVVRYSSPISAKAHQQAGTVLKKRIAELGYDVVTIHEDTSIKDVAKNYAAMKEVKSVQASVPFELYATADPKVSAMYHLDVLNIEKALQLAGDHEVTVGVVDTGVNRHHPELKNQIKTEVNSRDPLKRPLADAHGTHVAGIIAGEKGNGIGGYGVNPEARIVSIDVFNRDMFVFDYDIAEGILQAVEQDVDIINLSLGSYSPSDIIEHAVQKAIEAGIVIVAAAGNDASASITSYPAAYPGVISVGATNEKDERAFFSNYGPTIDVVAPGDSVYAPLFSVDKHATFDKLSGTSMSSPIVAGVASLLLSKHPNLTPYEVKYIIQQTASNAGHYDLTSGYGMVDPVKALEYDVKKLPEFTQETTSKKLSWNDEQEAKAADAFTKVGEAFQYEVVVEAGDFVQFELTGTPSYDLMFELQFENENGQDDPVLVNDASIGRAEGYLMRVEEAGSIKVTVKDPNEHYREDGKHTFTLNLSKEQDYKEDSITKNQPVEIEELPFSTADELDENLYLAGESGDSDYFRYTSKEGESVQVDVSALPGINVGIHVYLADEHAHGYADIPADFSFDYEDDGFGAMPMFSDYSTAIGVPKTFVFETMPETEYLIELTTAEDIWFDPYMLYFEEMEEVQPKSSHIPYTLSVKGAVPSKDEDGFPMYSDVDMPADEDVAVEDIFEDYREAGREHQQLILDMLLGGAGFYVDPFLAEEIIFASQPLELDEPFRAGFQYTGDQDVFHFTPEVNGIYHLDWNTTATLNPFVDVFKVEIDEETEEQALQPITFSGGYSYYDSNVNKTELYLGLEEGETYIFLTSNQVGYGQPSLDEYELELSSVKANPEDSYWKNDSFNNAKPVPSYAINGNLAMTGSSDFYYVEPAKQDELIGFHYESLQATNRQKQGLPEELFAQTVPLLLIVEDTDGDRELSEKEESNVSIHMPMELTETELRGSFRAKKGAGYFIVVANEPFLTGPTSFAPYRLDVSTIDPDRDEPRGFIQSGTGMWETTGFLPVASSSKKVTNSHRLVVKEAGEYTVQLSLPSDLDGVVTIRNSEGEAIQRVDHYGSGDGEHMTVKLKKGTYTVDIQDSNGNTSLHPYKVQVTK